MLKTGIALALTGVLAVAISACGSSGGGSGSVQSPLSQSLTGGKKGGTLNVDNHEDFEHLDPGAAYFANDYEVVYATQRPLYSYKPNSFAAPVPDLASGPAQVSADGKTVTVHIRSGVHYSPPVNREVTAADVVYAIDRGANPNVGNAYFPIYFSNLVGAAKASGGPFPGVTAPDKSTIVFHLVKPQASILISALALPLSAPVPPEFARKYDAMKPSAYGNYLVATGPYMMKSDASGKVTGIGYQTGKSAALVRNPNWNPATDFRPAYLDQINVSIGGDPTVIGRQVLTGSHLVQNDTPAPSIVKLAAQHYSKQITVVPGSGDHYVALDNARGPFTNVNLRRAVWAALNRTAMTKVRGGALVSLPATHFIYPGIAGFQEAGGYKGPQTDFNANVAGDMAVATKYMKAAGYPSGKYTGGKTVTIVGSVGSPAPEEAQIVNQTLQNLGFKTKFNLVDQSAMYAKYCGVPAQEIDVCPNVGFLADFANPYAVLDEGFNGAAITPTNSSNWSQTNDPQINKAMDAAVSITDPTQSAAAWAKIDEMLVNQAVAVPYDFGNQPVIESHDVAGVAQVWNDGAWDYSFTSLK
jgi:peptide/nickel transport system substrate-binding protein